MNVQRGPARPVHRYGTTQRGTMRVAVAGFQQGEKVEVMGVDVRSGIAFARKLRGGRVKHFPLSAVWIEHPRV